MPSKNTKFTYRTVSRCYRVSYHPEWYQEKPWICYHFGTAGRHFTSIEEAQEYFTKLGDPLVME